MPERNNLYPIFLKLSHLDFLIVGGGNVAEEKLSFLLKSSPNATVEIVAKAFKPELKHIAGKSQVTFIQDAYAEKYLENKHLVIAATDSLQVNAQIYKDARKRKILVNVADTPELCDFYLGGIVTRGTVKVAISTNGRSPTTAKRLRQFFEEVIPEDIDQLVNNLNLYRKTIKGSFADKVNKLNKITEQLLNN
ncbi:MAG: bifunctional precorrin-2 dehydrogenase/sirohydrochlorin ferrochelatase [Brumimicrobium sp.]|nr:bifunctional precorrin-2 dehydrogenase/sirohydrochlorin ferrochelatase [Brumimicrobium sp.]